jgi:hypothetical protein
MVGDVVCMTRLAFLTIWTFKLLFTSRQDAAVPRSVNERKPAYWRFVEIATLGVVCCYAFRLALGEGTDEDS